MTISEFSYEFDVLYDNASNSAPGLDPYEKSVFLTKAQEEIVLSYFSSKQNKPAEGFDDSEKRQMDFSNIIKTKSLSGADLDNADSTLYPINSKKASLSAKIDDLLIVVNEFAGVKRKTSSKDTISKDVTLTIVPIGYREYARLMSKPFKRPKNNQAWRLLTSDNGTEAIIIVGPLDEITSYTVRYVKKPAPIIIEDLQGLTIDTQSETSTECELNPILHREIVQRAVELAISAYSGNLSDKIALGNASQTDIGQGR